MALNLSWEPMSLAEGFRYFTECMGRHQPTFVVDRGLRTSLAHFPILGALPEARAEDLVAIEPAAPDGRWHTLMRFEGPQLERDMAYLAWCLQLWLNPVSLSDTKPPCLGEKTDVKPMGDLSAFLAALCYGNGDTRFKTALGEPFVQDWCRFLRKLGLGPRSIFEDPWFCALFLGGAQTPLPLGNPFIAVSLPKGRIDRLRAAKLLMMLTTRLALTTLALADRQKHFDIFLVDGRDLEPVLDALKNQIGETIDRFLPRDICFRILLLPDMPQLTEQEQHLVSKLVKLSRLKYAQPAPTPTAVTFLEDEKVDHCRPDFIRGLVHQYPPQCEYHDNDHHLEVLRALQKEQIHLGVDGVIFEFPEG